MHRLYYRKTDSSPATRRERQADPSGAADRLEEAFSRYQDELLGTLYYLLGNTEDARDALQETFVKCWRNRSHLGEIENLKAWIFRVALNAGRDMRAAAWRRRRRPLEKGNETLVARDVMPEADALRREQLALVRQAVRRLRREVRTLRMEREVLKKATAFFAKEGE